MSPGIRTGLSVILMATIVLVTACSGIPAETDPAISASPSQTGMVELDRVIDVALQGDAAELRDLLEFTATHCTFVEGLGGLPKCLDTENEGDPVEVLPFLGPEGHFIRKDAIESWQGLEVSKLYAVYAVSDAAYSDEYAPAGEYAIVFTGSEDEGTSITLQVRQGRIIRIDYGFEYPPQIRPNDVVRYLVPPAKTDP